MIELLRDPMPVLVAIPFVGAALGILLRSRPGMLKIWMLLVTLASLVMLVVVSRRLAGLPFLYLLPLAAFLSVLGQPVHQEAGAVWLKTLILLGLGLGVLASQDPLWLVLLVSLLGLVSWLIYRHQKLSAPKLWWGISLYSLGVASLVVSLVTDPPISHVALLLTYSVLLPLFPFHGGYVAALVGLPGNLPAFLALLLPAIGFHGVLTVMPGLPTEIVQAVVILALLGALYGSLKALAQSRVVELLAYANVAFYSILWWYLATARTATPPAAVYLSAVALVTGGLVLAWRSVQARYGDLDLNGIGGLARPMPRFAVLLALLVIAGMGLPPFGMFSGFMGMLLTPSLALSWSLIFIVIAWLSPSWYLLNMMHRILFGRHRHDLVYEDLRHTEIASLLIIVIMLAAIGTAPARLFEAGTQAHGYSAALESKLWNK